MNARNFAPGPSEIMSRVPEAAARAFESGLPGWSHRSPEFVAVVADLSRKLRAYLGLPDDFSVYYVASGSQGMDLCVRNLVRERCAGIDLGAFSRRFLDIAQAAGKTVHREVFAPGKGLEAWRQATGSASRCDFFKQAAWQESEAWLLCHNETATGVSVPLDELEDAVDDEPLRIVDCVSSAGALSFNWLKADAWFFGVQKAFGCPPGLGVILVGPRAKKRAEELEAEGRDTGGWYSFKQLEENARVDQTPCTPNTLGLAMFGAAVGELLERGSATVDAETKRKQASIHRWLADHPLLEAAIGLEADRSHTVVAIRFREAGDCPGLLVALKRKGWLLGGGYGDWKQSSFRIACFPAQDEASLADLLKAIDAELGVGAA